MSKISLKGLLLLFAVVAMALSLFLTNNKLEQKTAELNTLLQESRLLSVDDEGKIHAINFPGFGKKSYRWRIHIPSERRFRLKVAFDRIPQDGIPIYPPNLLLYNLPSGEMVLTANIFKEEGKWFLAFVSESEGIRKVDVSMEITGQNTAWLDEGGAPMVAGHTSIQQESVGDPFVLLSYRALLSQTPTLRGIDPSPTDGVAVWIEEVKP